MGLFSWIFSVAGKLVKSLFAIIIFFVIVFIIGRSCSNKLGDYEKLKDGYYQYKVTNIETSDIISVKFLNNNQCVIDGDNYDYYFTKYLHSQKNGTLGFEVMIKNDDSEEQKALRIVQGEKALEGGYLHAFLYGNSIPENTISAKEISVNYKTWNKGREFISSMEYEIMDSLVRDLIEPPKFLGFIE